MTEDTPAAPALPETAHALARAAEARLTAVREALATPPAQWTPDHYAVAEAMRNTIHTELQAVEAERFAITRPMDAAKAAIMEFFRKIETPLSRAKDDLGTAMKARNAEVERKRREEEERIQARERSLRAEEQRIADEAARIAREEADKEATRIAAEAAEKAARASSAEEADRIRADAEERVAEAVEAGEQLAAEAEQQSHAARFAPVPTIAREKPKGERDVYKGACDDLAKLAMSAVATHLRTICVPEQQRAELRAAIKTLQRLAGCSTDDYVHVPMTAILPNDKLIGQQARSLGHELRWPGVTVSEDKALPAARSR